MLAAGRRLDPANQVDREATERRPDDGEEREDSDGRHNHPRLAQVERPLPPVVPRQKPNEGPRRKHHEGQERQGAPERGQRLDDAWDRGSGAARGGCAARRGVAAGVRGTHAVHASEQAPQATRPGQTSPHNPHVNPPSGALAPPHRHPPVQNSPSNPRLKAKPVQNSPNTAKNAHFRPFGASREKIITARKQTTQAGRTFYRKPPLTSRTGHTHRYKTPPATPAQARTQTPGAGQTHCLPGPRAIKQCCGSEPHGVGHDRTPAVHAGDGHRHPPTRLLPMLTRRLSLAHRISQRAIQRRAKPSLAPA